MSSCFLLHGQRFSLLTFTTPAGIAQPGHAQNESWFVYLEKGFLAVEDERGYWTVLPGRIGWMPPHFHYEIRAYGHVAGICASLTPLLCAGLPEIPSALAISSLVAPILERAVTWQPDGVGGVFQPLPARQERLLQVLLDELRYSSQGQARLLLPKDKRLNYLAREILKNPGERRTVEEWAERMRISSRSISRHFSRETNMTFAQWRQNASLIVAMKRLAEGESVREAARSVGYENVSAFITSFKKAFGQTPAQFRQQFD
ncbi:helix-turn-helix domain-containing protein [Oxalobacter paraformigenes]|uniref:HTH araC/xylS-type domain-containing protein n=1 Tax=Oxalobacter paraformigenes TaxID=556268 RepID=C3X452_9BURK|nr:AraC family transcriptional regulator [Oxalobacter paraformigenes]EEO27988.2 hypothetical protein OFAG_01141 [Oxalobacter paraformigenes]